MLSYILYTILFVLTDTIYIVDAEQINQPVTTLDDNEQTTYDVSSATNKSVARTHITLYVILYFVYDIMLTLSISTMLNKPTNRSFNLDDNEQTTDDISPATNKSVAYNQPYNILLSYIFYTILC